MKESYFGVRATFKIYSLLRGLLYAGTETLPNDDKKFHECVCTNCLSICIFIASILLGITVIITSGHWAKFLDNGTGLCTIFLVITLNALKKYRLANTLFFLSVNFNVFYFFILIHQSIDFPLVTIFFFQLAILTYTDFKTIISITFTAIIFLVCWEISPNLIIPASRKLTMHPNYWFNLATFLVLISASILILNYFGKNGSLLKSLYNGLTKYFPPLIGDAEKVVNMELLKEFGHDVRGAYFGVTSIVTLLQIEKEQNRPVSRTLVEELVSSVRFYQYFLDYFAEAIHTKGSLFETPRYETINVKVELKRIVNHSLYYAKEKDVRIQLFVSNEFPNEMVVDKLKLVRIFMNVLNNAIKFTRPNTTIAIRITQEQDSWKFTIIDEGKGIPFGKTKQIFKAYFTERTIENPDGLGLGLFIVKRLVRLLNGNINVRSKANIGALFEVTLPCH